MTIKQFIYKVLERINKIIIIEVKKEKKKKKMLEKFPVDHIMKKNCIVTMENNNIFM